MTKATYRDPRWRKVRRLVLDRDRHLCQIKRSKCTTKATEVDHIVAVADGGAQFDPANLRAACKSCNIGQRNERVAELAREARSDTQPKRIRGRAWSRDWDNPPPKEETCHRLMS